MIHSHVTMVTRSVLWITYFTLRLQLCDVFELSDFDPSDRLSTDATFLECKYEADQFGKLLNRTGQYFPTVDDPWVINTTWKDVIQKSFLLSELTSSFSNSSDSTSCRHRCFLDMHLPCSCSKECVIFDNCCEDVDLHCPNVRTEGLEQYHYLLHTKVECDWKSGIYMIKSCPSQVHSNTSKLSRPSTEVPEPLRDALDPDANALPKWNPGLRYVIANTPVTDALTSMTYVNYSIFQCAAQLDAQPLLWKPVLTLNSHLAAPDQLDQIPEDDELWFLPPSPYPKEAMNYPCIASAIGTCDVEQSEHYAPCRDSGKNYVFQTLRSIRRYCFNVYKNKHCGLCDKDADTNQTLSPFAKRMDGYSAMQRFDDRMRILFDISSKKVSLTTKPFSGDATLARPWKNANCAMENGEFKCSIVKCTSHFSKTDDKRCLLKHESYFVVVIDEPEQRNAIGFIKEYVAYFAKCYFTSLGYKVTHIKSIEVEGVEDGAPRLTLRLINYFANGRLRMLEDTSTNSPNYVGYHLKQIALLSKLVVAYTKVFEHCTSNKWKSTSPLGKVTSHGHSSYAFPIPMNDVFTQTDESINAQIVQYAMPKNISPIQSIHMTCKKLFNPAEPWLSEDKLDSVVSLSIPTANTTTCVCSVTLLYGWIGCAPTCFDFPQLRDDKENIESILEETCPPLEVDLSHGSKQSDIVDLWNLCIVAICTLFVKNLLHPNRPA